MSSAEERRRVANAQVVSVPAENSPFYHSIYFITLAALALRLAVITIGHTYRITPRGDHFQFAWEVGRIARSIATGHGFSSPTDLPSGPTAWMAPVYTYILAGVFKLFGVYSPASAWVILAFNSLCAALTCVTIYRIGEEIYGLEVARWAAWTWAMFPYLIYWPVRVVYDTSFSAFLLSLSLLLTIRMAKTTPRAREWVGFGLLWGVIVLTNPSLMTMLTCSLLWLLYRMRRWRAWAMGSTLCIVVCMAVVSPWLARNYRVFGKFVFIRDNLPLELYMSNNHESVGFWTRNEHPANDRQAMERFHELGEARYMADKGRQAREFIRDNPATFAEFTLKRALYFWISPPQAAIVGGYDFDISRHMNYFLEAAFAFAGLWLSFRRHIPEAYLLACFLLVYPLPYYIVSPYPRYKHLIEPEMLLMIVYLLWEARTVQVRWPLKESRLASY
ncbi:MAG TPA: glycosyltransferase family 39 protein [Terriglobales bacterium]|nr:glycosyltransferase family 39 protein [Terriglobales bacterium]